MKPLQLEFQAFGPYPDHQVIDFEKLSSQGLFLICGETGSGKTMLLDAMTFALYGMSSGHGRDDFHAMRCTTAEYETSTFVKITFDIDGSRYVFERRLDRKRKNLSESYSMMRLSEDGVWEPLSENPKKADLNKKAVELVGLDYEQFRQVIILPQGQFEKLLTSNSDEKEKILTSIFGENKWQKIAEYFLEEASSRREAFRKKKEKIENSLKEENCTDMSQLAFLIRQKQEEQEEAKQQFQNAGLEQRTAEIQEKQKLIQRFEALELARQKERKLVEKEELRNQKATQLMCALRAEAVRTELADDARTRKEVSDRKQKYNEAVKASSDANQLVEDIRKKLSAHLEQKPEYDKMIQLKAAYESKRPVYENIEQTRVELEESRKIFIQAQKQEERAKEQLKKIQDQVMSAEQKRTKMNQEYDQLLKAYLAGITGILAKDLADGEACPVCGSTFHPNKACIAGDSVTKQQVDEKKAKADAQNNQVRKLAEQAELASKTLAEKGSAASDANAVMSAVSARYENEKQNLIQEIESLKQLETRIQILKNQIHSYEEKKNSLEEEIQNAENNRVKIQTRIESADREVLDAKKAEMSATEQLKKKLCENGFSDADAARSMLLDISKRQALQKHISEYDADRKNATEQREAIEKELEGIEMPDAQECIAQMKEINKQKEAYHLAKGKRESEIQRLQKKEKLLLAEGDGIEAQIQEAENDWAFAKRLRGDSGTGLQRYVLGIMFSSVVSAANKMLELVHGGRYRLFRSDDKAQGSNKRGLELKVLDRFSQDPAGRFVNTLSGGEKFLASLALSIGMSTVAGKSGIRIQALFIDEGFGSLDENSISDAMNVLNTIQESNGLVGIISHVQLLRDRIPAKLIITKKEGKSSLIESIG